MTVSADSNSLEHRIIQRILAESDSPLTAADVKEDSELRGDLGLGSLQAVSLAMSLEDEFGVTVEDEELQTLVTVGDVMRLVRDKQAGISPQ
jgi:acyl carrier protein